MVTRALDRARGPNFPDSDGDPMPERASHQDQVTYTRFAFGQITRDWPRVYVGGNHFLYYNPDRQEDNVAPDAFVAVGVERREREKYQTWDEDDHFPDLVVEILSPKTRKEDLGKKKELYARLGALEYFVHDAQPRVRERVGAGWRLVDGMYQPIPLLPTGGWWSEVLGTELRVIGRWLRVIDPRTEQAVPTPEEEALARRAAEDARLLAERRAQREAEARRAAETHAAREGEARRAAETQAAQEVQARQAAEAHTAELQAELARLRALLENR